MKDKSNLSNASDYFNFNSNNVSGISKNNALNLTKLSNESNEFKELNKEIFQMIQQGGNLSGFNNTNLSISSNNNSNSLPSFNDINWKKKCSHENSSFFDKKDGNNSSISSLGIIPKKQIEVLNMRNTFDEKDISYNNNNNPNTNNNNNNNNNNNINNNKINTNNYNKNNNYNGNNYNNKYNKFSLIPEDSQENPVENRIHFTNVKKIQKNENKFNNINNNINNNLNQNLPNNTNINTNNNNTNNLMLNYTNMLNINNTTNISSKNFVKKNNFQNMMNNPQNNNNMMLNNMRAPQNSNPNYLYYQNQLNPNMNSINNMNNMNSINNMNNYYYNNQAQQYMFPENAFSYNNTNVSQSQNSNMSYQNNNQSNWKDNNEKKNKNKKKFKEKIEQKLFVIDLDNIIKGTDERTTVMIRHIPNKYTSQTLLDELNIICKNKYDFFYLPIDNDNDCNLGYAFINFINPLHIVHFYHIFKARKWKLYKSNKECDLTFAKFQGKSELTANLDKNMNKIEDKKKLPMVFDVLNPPKIDLEKKYYDEIKMNRSELLKNINWI